MCTSAIGFFLIGFAFCVCVGEILGAGGRVFCNPGDFQYKKARALYAGIVADCDWGCNLICNYFFEEIVVFTQKIYIFTTGERVENLPSATWVADRG